MFDVNIYIHDPLLCCALLWKESLLYYILLWLWKNPQIVLLKEKDIVEIVHFEVYWKQKVMLIFIPSLCLRNDKANLEFFSLLPLSLFMDISIWGRRVSNNLRIRNLWFWALSMLLISSIKLEEFCRFLASIAKQNKWDRMVSKIYYFLVDHII